MSTRPGLRERKKQQTRQLIAETAQRLFAERGFDAVTVAEVARAADVSEGTVFNYFPTKEDLFYSGMEAFEARLVEAVRARPAGQPVLDAFRDVVLEGTSRLAGEDAVGPIAEAARVVGASAALRARERELVAQYTAELADLLRAGDPALGEVEAAAVAAALMGVQRALVAHVHARVLGGARGKRLAAEVRAEGERAFERLEQGLAGYAPRPRA